MNTKRFLIGTLAGGITMYLIGYLIWDLALTDFFSANAGSAQGLMRESNIAWAVVLGILSLSALFTIVVGRQTASPTILNGLKLGAIVGFLVWFGVDFILYGYTNIRNLTATIIDPLLEIVRGGLCGAVIAAVLGKLK